MAMSSILNSDDIKKALDAFKGKECVNSFLSFCQTTDKILLYRRVTHNSDDWTKKCLSLPVKKVFTMNLQHEVNYKVGRFIQKIPVYI